MKKEDTSDLAPPDVKVKMNKNKAKNMNILGLSIGH
jgi:hypothetical protein